MKRYNPCSTGVTLAAVPMPDGDIAITAVTTKAGKAKATKGRSAPVRTTVTVITLTINHERDLVELRFPGKPDEAVRSEMKAAKFRWYGPAGCWYHKHTPENRAWAEAFIGRQGRTQPVAHQYSSAAGVPITTVVPVVIPSLPVAVPVVAVGHAALDPANVTDIDEGEDSAIWNLNNDMNLEVLPDVPAPSKGQCGPRCVFCGRSGSGVQFAIFSPRFAPFGTACTACEASLPPGTVVPSANRDGFERMQFNIENTPPAKVAVPQLAAMSGMTPLGLKSANQANCEISQTEPKCLTAHAPKIPAWRQRLVRH